MKLGPMRIATPHALVIGLAALSCAAVGLSAQQSVVVQPGNRQPATQQPPPPQPPPTRAAQPAGPRPPVPRSPQVDQAAHDRGRAIWAIECVGCHGPQARGSDTGPNIIRSKTVNYDRSAPQAGSELGPFLKAGHPTQSKKPSSSFTDAEIADLANFLRARVNDTMRGSAIFTVGDIVTGDASAGETYFRGAGGCATCHTASDRSLAGIATRISAPVDLQQRMLFPGTGRAGRAGGRARGGPPAAGAAAAAPAADRNAITVAVSAPGAAPLSGVLVEESDFYVTLRDADGTTHTVRRAPGTKVTKTNPLQAHIDLLDRITDAQIHDVVAYLETLK
jgi:mono/diheme cytochrome c family protein